MRTFSVSDGGAEYAVISIAEGTGEDLAAVTVDLAVTSGELPADAAWVPVPRTVDGSTVTARLLISQAVVGTLRGQASLWVRITDGAQERIVRQVEPGIFLL